MFIQHYAHAKYFLCVSHVTTKRTERGKNLISFIPLSICIGCFMNVGVEGWLTDGCGYGAMANG